MLLLQAKFVRLTFKRKSLWKFSDWKAFDAIFVSNEKDGKSRFTYKKVWIHFDVEFSALKHVLSTINFKTI